MIYVIFMYNLAIAAFNLDFIMPGFSMVAIHLKIQYNR